jgi:hypothetical protein
LKDDNSVNLLNNLEKQKENICRLIDCGKCFYYKNKISKKSKKININKIEGNICFTSVNVLKDEIPERIDDIISLSYLLIYLNKGYLPWSNVEKTNKKLFKKTIFYEKEKFNANLFYDGDINGLTDFYNYVIKFPKKDAPDYKYLKCLLGSAIIKIQKIPKDLFKYAWEKKFHSILEEFYLNKNFELLNDTLDTIFNGYPRQLAFEYINQYYN